jgi:hypothetical protein
METTSSAKCPKCESINNFKAEVIEVENYGYKLNVIICAKCHTAITFMDYANIGGVLDKIQKFLKIK